MEWKDSTEYIDFFIALIQDINISCMSLLSSIHYLVAESTASMR